MDDGPSVHQNFAEVLVHPGAKGILMGLRKHQSLWDLAFN